MTVRTCPHTRPEVQTCLMSTDTNPAMTTDLPQYAASCHECLREILGHERIWIQGRGPTYRTFCSESCQISYLTNQSTPNTDSWINPYNEESSPTSVREDFLIIFTAENFFAIRTCLSGRCIL
jgi:hypothetical protein